METHENVDHDNHGDGPAAGSAKGFDILWAAPPAWIHFAQAAIHQEIAIATNPEEAASRFRRWFRLPFPMGWHDFEAFFHSFEGHLTYTTVPLLEEEHDLRGEWNIDSEGIRIYVNGTRPEASRIKTFFHETFEVLVAIERRLILAASLSIDDREKNANRFAAAIKMPPEEFVPRANSCGLFLEGLAEDCDDTIAGVGRRIRDLIANDTAFYIARCHLEKAPERRCPTLMETMDASGGICVRVADIIRTQFVTRRKSYNGRFREGALPLYNVPTRYQWRVMPREVRRVIDENRPIFIPAIRGGASWKFRPGPDLFGEYDLSVLIVPFSAKRERGVYVIAIHPNAVHLIAPQLKMLKPTSRDDIDWIFSHAGFNAKRPRRLGINETDVDPSDPRGTSVNLSLCGFTPDGEAEYDLGTLDYELIPRVATRRVMRNSRTAIRQRRAALRKKKQGPSG